MMAIGSSIDKAVAKMRFVIDLYDVDNTTHYYYSDHTWIDSAGVVAHGRVETISNLDIEMSDTGEPSIPSLDFTLLDTDGTIKALGVKGDWEVYLKIGTKDIAISAFNSVKFKIASPVKISEGVADFRCELFVNLGKINAVYMDDTEAVTLGATEDLTQQALPWHKGEHVAPNGAIELRPVNTDKTRWLLHHTNNAGWDGDEDLVDLFMMADSDPDNWQQFKHSGSDEIWYMNTVALTPTKFPTSTNLKYIQITADASGLAQLDSSPASLTDANFIANAIANLSVNLRGQNPTGSADIESPIETIRQLFEDLISDTDNTALSTAGYISTNITELTDRIERDGLYSALKVEGENSTLSVLSQAMLNTGLAVYFDVSGKLKFHYYQNDDSGVSAAGYSSEDLITDYNHCLAISRSDFDIINGLRVNSTHRKENDYLEDTDAQLNGFDVIGSFDANLSPGSALQAAWRYIQKRRGDPECRQWAISLPHMAFDYSVADILRLTERITALTAGPCLIKKISYNVNKYTVDLLLEDLEKQTATNPFTLIDESTLERTYPTTTASVTTASGVVTLSNNVAHVYDIAVGDIFETFSDDNQYSSKVIVAPNWTGAVWQMTVADVADTIEAVASTDWVCKVSYLTASVGNKANSGFLCDTDGEFTDGDPGQVGVM
jgi:hypothetical protein